MLQYSYNNKKTGFEHNIKPRARLSKGVRLRLTQACFTSEF